MKSAEEWGYVLARLADPDGFDQSGAELVVAQIQADALRHAATIAGHGGWHLDIEVRLHKEADRIEKGNQTK